MEQSSSSQNEPESPFFCHLCGVSCASALNLQSHFLGIKHRKVEEALRNNKTDEKKTTKLKPTATLQEHIDACKNSEPAVGLQYVYQYTKFNYNTYECKLCDCRSGLTHMFMHIVGAKHRMNYLSKHHPAFGISGSYIMRGPKKLKKLRDICLSVEKEYGRQKINVLDAVATMWSLTSDSSGASSLYYAPDSKMEQMDFTSDDFFDTDVKPAASEHVVTFLELKAAHEANQKKTASSSDSVEHNAEDSESKVKDTDGESKKDTHEKEVDSKEPCESDQDFTSNKELIDFLEHFRILEDGDAKFLNSVVEMLSVALTRHQRISKQKEETKLSVTKCQKQDPAPSVVPPNTNQGPVSEFKGKLPPFGTKPPVPSVSSNMPPDPEAQSPKQLFPVPQSNQTEPLHERKKLMFVLPSKMAKESEVKCNQSQESLGSTTSYNATTNVLNQEKREDTPAGYNQKKTPASQFGNDMPTGESHPSSLQASALHDPVYSAPQVNRGAPFAQTRFAPPRAPFPPRAAPPLFPIGNNDIMNKFFESIKNMEVAEVISTLNKIAATNPAFKGIHVPSLIRYLKETGKLKSEPSMQQLNQ